MGILEIIAIGQIMDDALLAWREAAVTLDRAELAYESGRRGVVAEMIMARKDYAAKRKFFCDCCDWEKKHLTNINSYL